MTYLDQIVDDLNKTQVKMTKKKISKISKYEETSANRENVRSFVRSIVSGGL